MRQSTKRPCQIGSRATCGNLAVELSSRSFSGLVELDIRIQKSVPCEGHIEKKVYLQRNKDKARNDDLATTQL
jgi:hypothetical protein